MELKELIRFLKYESDVNLLIDTAAKTALATKTIPNDNECNLLIAALAVSDQLSGLKPASTNSFYCLAYNIAESLQ